MKYYIISGEASGDLHASNLMKSLKDHDNAPNFRFWGGDRMVQQGGTLVKHYRDLAFMGFIEVIKNLRAILGNLRFCKEDIKSYNPDAVILVDYPGFNLRIAEWAHKNGYRVFYYISPQVWAWKRSRVKKIKRIVDKMFVILPFEKEFYAKYNYEVDFVGHPLLDELSDLKPSEPIQDHDPNKKIIALLPGSRKQEISRMLPGMLQMTHLFPEYQFIIAAAPSIEKDFYEYYLKNTSAAITFQGTYNLLRQSYAAIVTSGTATLETALLNVPEVVCYRGNTISYWIARYLVHVPFISLVNLIPGTPIVEELIQSDFNPNNLKAETEKILDPNQRKTILDNYRIFREKLGGPGASERTASKIVEILHQK